MSSGLCLLMIFYSEGITQPVHILTSIYKLTSNFSVLDMHDFFICILHFFFFFSLALSGVHHRFTRLHDKEVLDYLYWFNHALVQYCLVPVKAQITVWNVQITSTAIISLSWECALFSVVYCCNKQMNFQIGSIIKQSLCDC